MVSLGSSFAAGPGVEPVLDRAAGRSGRNYAQLVATRLGATLVDATVSGATTATILHTPQRVVTRVFPPQIESVHAGADLVTVTVGGNDLGYLGGIMGTALVGQLGHPRLIQPIVGRIRARRGLRPVTPEQQAAATDGLARIVHEVQTRAPQARVVLVDYLPVFTDSTIEGPGVRLTAVEIEHFCGVAADLSAAFAEASRRTGADLVPASVYGQGHGAGSPDPLVNVLRLQALGTSFHPTPAGMQAVADAIFAQLVTTHREA